MAEAAAVELTELMIKVPKTTPYDEWMDVMVSSCRPKGIEEEEEEEVGGTMPRSGWRGAGEAPALILEFARRCSWLPPMVL